MTNKNTVTDTHRAEFSTGSHSAHPPDDLKSVLCPAGVREVIVVQSQSYMRHLVEQANLHFITTGKIKETGHIVTAMKVVTLHNPKLTVEV